eukprot:gene13539-395_t
MYMDRNFKKEQERVVVMGRLRKRSWDSSLRWPDGRLVFGPLNLDNRGPRNIKIFTTREEGINLLRG